MSGVAGREGLTRGVCLTLGVDLGLIYTGVDFIIWDWAN